ncbi:HAMP domain-containing histidine kinase [Leptolyngbya sp. FACHB-36]|uniref:sensor histidine kinase n=1 Tax=Leptolyngbya sp. FACHB-36 TaxID=2692808 RepID=UPI0016812056|nr:HAMP domain-containing sensor histidine kinase [Leptolyngbya sp. FACHB-36]MBD2020571.1 HAMP domain-containing histidine kinase [Leptolyngbya sp. FACHB-36]
MAVQVKRQRAAQAKGTDPIDAILEWITRKGASLQQFKMPAESADYQAWRHRFMNDRLRVVLKWIIIPCVLTLLAQNIYIIVFNAEQFNSDVAKLYGPTVVEQFRNVNLALIPGILVPLVVCLIMQRTQWGQRHPAAIFLSISWSLTLSEQLICTLFGLPAPPGWTMEFLGTALMIPLCWRLHLVAQLVPIAYYVVVYPLLGITKIGTRSIYDSYAIGAILSVFWVCLICDLAVYMYERLKRSEFESQRQLRVFLHSVSHDLKTPVMGTSVVLQGLLETAKRKGNGEKIGVDHILLEQLLEGSDRQLELIDSLLNAYRAEAQGILLSCEPLTLSSVLDTVLCDLSSLLVQNRIQVMNHIRSDLPLVHGDRTQLWRVFSNLISNALKHNPSGVTLTLEAEVCWQPGKEQFGFGDRPVRQPTFPTILCRIRDSGIGIPVEQQSRLFDLYTRGSRARYMPGIGLGLYLCRQIIAAHGGEIGVISQPGEGATFWFTLPIYQPDAEGGQIDQPPLPFAL